MVEYRLSLLLAIGQVLKMMWHFKILTYESMGKPKMRNISKTTNRSAKLMKIWDSGLRVHMEGTLMPDSLSFFGGHSVRFAKFPIL